MKRRIYIKTWLEFKPYTQQVPSDSYYLKLANEIRNVLQKHEDNLVYYFEDEAAKDYFCCFLASYFEDIISGTNIWNTFVKLHTQFYGKKLPFYNTDEYYESEPNVQDVAFLIWYCFNCSEDLRDSARYDLFWTIAEEITALLDKEYEYAPENNHLLSYYTLDAEEKDFAKVFSILNNVFCETYLLFYDTKYTIETEIVRTFCENENSDNLELMLTEIRHKRVLNSTSRLINIHAKHWLAGFLGDEHPLYHDVKNISNRVSGLFFYKGQNDEFAFFEHIASGKKFDVLKHTFFEIEELKDVDTPVFIGLVKWQGHWWISGTHGEANLNKEAIQKEKESQNSLRQINLIDGEYSKKMEYVNLQKECFLELSKGSIILFMTVPEIREFIKNFYQYYNSKIAKQLNQAQQNRTDGLNLLENVDDELSGLVFFNANSGIEIAYGVNSAFPLSNNPYYDEKLSDDDVDFLLISDDFSPELVKYMMDNCKDKLAFFKTERGEMFIEEFDFLMRFHKRDNYHAKPEITLK